MKPDVNGLDQPPREGAGSDSLHRLAELFLTLGPDGRANIDRIVGYLCQVTGGMAALYNRLDVSDQTMVVWSGHNLPPDMPDADEPTGHICFEATIKGRDRTVLIDDLRATSYQKTDPAVSRYGLRSYLGHPVSLHGRAVGSLAVVDGRVGAFTEQDQAVVQMLAKLVALEEARLEAGLRLERMNRVLTTSRAIGHLILSENDRGRLITAICRLLVEQGDFRGAWLILFDEERKLAGMAQAGLGGDFTRLEKRLAEGNYPVCVETALGPDGVALVRDIETYCTACPLSHASVGCGAVSMALREQNRVFGILTVALPVVFVEDHDERKLLGQIAGDIAIALHSLEQKEQLRRDQSRAEQERLLSAIEQSSDVIYITDLRGLIQYVNPAFEAVTGYRREEVIGRNPRMLKSGVQDAGFYQNLWATLLSGQTWKGAFVNRRKDGGTYTVEASISPVRDASGQVVNYVAVNRDITQELRERNAKEELENQLVQAQKLESIGRLAGGVAHDFNNTLQVIIGGAESVLRHEEISPVVRESVEEMRRAAERSAGLTRQLLAFARQQTVIPVVVNLNAAVESSLRMLRRLVGEDITLNWRASDVPLTVSIDPVQVDQILANLVVNARDAISGVGTISIFTERCVLDEVTAHGFPEATAGAYARVCVEDTGCGMDQATLARIFEPFFTTKPTGEGTGLGLATVYGIVKQNGGVVDVHSTPGKGTVFCLCLPIVEKPVAAEQPAPVKAVVGGDTGTVLVVEDEPAIAHMVEKFLQMAGYTVLVAGSPAAALERVDAYRGNIDLLLADVVMPGMSGRDLALTLTARIPGLRCLFMSGYTADIIAHRGQIDASIAFLSKPFTSAELLSKVRATLTSVVPR